MEDPLADDVKELLDKEKGDERILKQILRACENDELVSNYERNYVRKLAEKYLYRESGTEESRTAKESEVPDVQIPNASSAPNAETVVMKPPAAKPDAKNRKALAVFAAVALVIVIAAAVSMSGQPDDSVTAPVETPVSPPDTLSIRTDLPSYQKGDLISISGNSPVSGSVNISITNQQNQLAWTDTVTVKGDGRYSSLAIAGGAGWQDSGTFTITADNRSESASSTFSFSS